jgi:RHS repeat-associated protein
VEYVYDATGNKLTTKDYAAGGSTPQTTTDYIGSFVYENGILTLFSAAEGRVVNKSGTLEYQYGISDHQGNTRLVFSSVTPAADAPVASFEGDTGDKSSEYANIVPGNVVSFAAANHTTGGIKVLRINQTTKVAATKSLHVYPGDKVDLEVWEYHEGASGFGTTGTSASSLVTLVASAFATGVAGVDAQISSGVNAGITAFGTGGGNQGDSRPAAYLNYILFDKDFNVLNMGWQLAPATTFTKQKLSFSTIGVKEEGYLFAYLSYDDDSNNWVYFDDLKVTHTKTNVMQYNEYYPFGLQASTSWTRTGSKNNFLYDNGGELNPTTGVYDLVYRNYDPVLGRLNQIDPKADKYASLSPYSYAGNDPVLNNDPFGDDWLDDLNAAQWAGEPYMGPANDGGGYDASTAGYGFISSSDAAVASAYGMSSDNAARFASLADYGASWNFGYTDYGPAIAAGNAVLSDRAANRGYEQELLRAAQDGNPIALQEYAQRYGLTIPFKELLIDPDFSYFVDKFYAGPGIDPDADELIRQYQQNQILGWGYIFAGEILLENGVFGERINKLRNDLVGSPMFHVDKNTQMVNKIINATVQAVKTVKGFIPGNGKTSVNNKLTDPYFTAVGFYFAVRGTYLLYENETILAPKILIQNPDYYNKNIAPIFSPQQFNGGGASFDW